jgi:hypothetical protein
LLEVDGSKFQWKAHTTFPYKGTPSIGSSRSISPAARKTPKSKRCSKSKSSPGSLNSVEEKLSEEEKSWIKEWIKEDEAHEVGSNKKRPAPLKTSTTSVIIVIMVIGMQK